MTSSSPIFIWTYAQKRNHKYPGLKFVIEKECVGPNKVLYGKYTVSKDFLTAFNYFYLWMVPWMAWKNVKMVLAEIWLAGKDCWCFLPFFSFRKLCKKNLCNAALYKVPCSPPSQIEAKFYSWTVEWAAIILQEQKILHQLLAKKSELRQNLVQKRNSRKFLWEFQALLEQN